MLAENIKELLENPSKMNGLVMSGSEFDVYDDGTIGHDNVELGVFIKYKGKTSILFNADEGEEYDLVQVARNDNLPNISFLCLEKLVNVKRPALIKLLHEDKIKVVDHVAEQWKDMPPEQYKKYTGWLDLPLDTKHKTPCPVIPPFGFTFAGGSQFHRPCTVVLKDTRKNGKTMILGMDENQYFGCDLADNPTTVNAAFISLTPKEIRGKKNVVRQGEWFFAPVSQKEFPSSDKFDALLNNFALPIDDPESNLHNINCKKGGVFKKQFFLKDPQITHPEHQTLTLKGHYTVFKNLALRSVSQEGVD